MRNPYKTRKGGATVTVFVPYDCNNNCPFCINKREYKDMSNFSLEKILESIKIMDNITPECDFVVTGGEPLADLMGLQKILDCMGPSHRIFINTTMPVSASVTEEDLLEFFEKNKNKITCINISRHMQKFVVESNNELIAKLPVPFRINCVLFEDYPVSGLKPFAERFLSLKGASIQFRFDYTKTTPQNLYDKDKIFSDICSFAEYKGLDACRMRCGFHYDYKGMSITYHKTLPYSTIVESDKEDGITYDILYDILIKQTGAIHADWADNELKGDDLLLDTDAYRKVKFEPYDLKWIETV